MKKEVYQCDRCGAIGTRTAFAGDKRSADGWLQVTPDVHYCPECTTKYEEFMAIKEEEK
jgi:rubredoxin